MYLPICVPNEDLNQPVHLLSLIKVLIVSGNFATLAIQNLTSEDSDQTTNAQSDLNLHWEHMSEGAFSDVVAQILDNSPEVM